MHTPFYVCDVMQLELMAAAAHFCVEEKNGMELSRER